MTINISTDQTYILGANVENLTLTGTAAINGTGNSLANIITGNCSNNILNGGGGADILIGGLGNDTYVIGNTGVTVTEAAAHGTDLVQASVSYSLTANVENLTLTGTAAINGTGNSLANTIRGNSSNNVLNGGGGTDILIGGLGNDTYVIGNTGVTVTEATSQGTDLVQASVSYSLTANVENLTLTGTSVINGTGNSLVNTITGNSSNNILNGGGGSDILVGGLGNDTYIIGNTGVTVTEATAQGTDLVQASISYTLGNDIENLTLTGTAAINGTGNSLANTIRGNNLNNILNGIGGADILIGGLGNDTYIIGNTGVIVTEAAAKGIDFVQASVSYSLSSNVENLTLTGTSAINGTGKLLRNTITGNSLNNILNGGGGTDILVGGLGNDTYVIGNIGVTVTEAATQGTDLVQASVSYSLTANVENLTLTGNSAINGTGNSLVNTITGNSSNNILSGVGGADILIGGLGNDTYVIGNTGVTVTEAATQGTDLVQASISYILGNDIENLTLTGTAVINGTGNSLANTIKGNSLDNILNGVGGADILIGGLGNDTYVIGNTGVTVTEAAAKGTDLVQASVSYTLTANVENLTLTGTSAINGTGNLLTNTITGNSLNNVLSGGGGTDILIGGLGNDTYVIGNTGVIVTEAATQGTDLVQASISYTLDANVENLTLTGTAAINGTGNSLVNTITGNSLNNVLNGGGGSDILVGGLGNDTYVIDNTGITVTEAATQGTDLVQASISYTLGTDIENLTLTGNSAINGTGNSLANTIRGNSLDNILSGVGGADILIGGLGNDTYVIGNTGVTVTEAVAIGTDLVQASVSYTLRANVENLTLTGNSAINGTGNSLANTITGNSLDNILSGGGGADILIGGLGNDTYVIGNTGVTVTEATAQGTDLVQASISYTLDANVENLTLTGITAINGTGNSLANTITGNSLNNILNGGGGSDILVGGLGNDTYMFNVGDNVDSITDSSGTDLIKLGNLVNKNKIAFFTDSSGNFSVDYGNSTGVDKITVNSWSTTGNQIEKIRLDDSTYLTNTEINTIIQNMTAYATEHSIALTSVSDVKNNSELMSLYMNNSWHN